MTTRELTLVAEAREAARSGRGREIRAAADLSQIEMACAIAVAPATISRWESGDRRPRGAAAIRWVRLLRTLEATSTVREEDSAALAV